MPLIPVHAQYLVKDLNYGNPFYKLNSNTCNYEEKFEVNVA